jgi:hypothetical protein
MIPYPWARQALILCPKAVRTVLIVHGEQKNTFNQTLMNLPESRQAGAKKVEIDLMREVEVSLYFYILFDQTMNIYALVLFT